jgi:hypothetical protein
MVRSNLSRSGDVRGGAPQDETLVTQTLPFSPVILGQFPDFLGLRMDFGACFTLSYKDKAVRHIRRAGMAGLSPSQGTRSQLIELRRAIIER